MLEESDSELRVEAQRMKYRVRVQDTGEGTFRRTLRKKSRITGDIVCKCERNQWDSGKDRYERKDRCEIISEESPMEYGCAMEDKSCVHGKPNCCYPKKSVVKRESRQREKRDNENTTINSSPFNIIIQQRRFIKTKQKVQAKVIATGDSDGRTQELEKLTTRFYITFRNCRSSCRFQTPLFRWSEDRKPKNKIETTYLLTFVLRTMLVSFCGSRFGRRISS